MTTASTPEDTGRLFGEAISRADLEEALSLFEPDAAFAMPKGFGEGWVNGNDRLREVFLGFLALSPELRIEAERTILAGDTALVIGHWTFSGRDPDGHDIQATGRYTDVVRRQPDAGWRFVIDNANGSD